VILREAEGEGNLGREVEPLRTPERQTNFSDDSYGYGDNNVTQGTIKQHNLS
jgi:hypothetical protein